MLNGVRTCSFHFSDEKTTSPLTQRGVNVHSSFLMIRSPFVASAYYSPDARGSIHSSNSRFSSTGFEVEITSLSTAQSLRFEDMHLLSVTPMRVASI
ncbi:hypothetical protein NPIL_68821 [Nephila pilipes]|uniref:Uncharacterized protein n=1 Tax=Nephila pilipes TaxID=299642 RepID=A0A8X6U225_NEPPI|nr:hypothetical protein NPIL_68821 [Nephila pilipes]